MITNTFQTLDHLWRTYGFVLDTAGFGPQRSASRIIYNYRKRWHLREFGSGNHKSGSVLIIASPIKQPYIWDIARSISIVEYISEYFNVYMLEWKPVSDADANELSLSYHVKTAIGEAVKEVQTRNRAAAPFLIGHSLGGTFAAMHTALATSDVRALILLSAPLQFIFSNNTFNKVYITLAKQATVQSSQIPGSLLSCLSTLAAPETFVWFPIYDTLINGANGERLICQARVWRWLLDEMPIPRLLGEQIFKGLYLEDQFYKGELQIGAMRIGPNAIKKPTLAVMNQNDVVAPPASVRKFMGKMRGEHDIFLSPFEGGVTFQHLSILIGREARKSIWPEIVTWMHAR